MTQSVAMARIGPGVVAGGKPEAVAKLREEGLGPTEIAKRLGIGRASVYRVMGMVNAPPAA